jgi:hypothetical protein
MVKTEPVRRYGAPVMVLTTPFFVVTEGLIVRGWPSLPTVTQSFTTHLGLTATPAEIVHEKAAIAKHTLGHNRVGAIVRTGTQGKRKREVNEANRRLSTEKQTRDPPALPEALAISGR